VLHAVALHDDPCKIVDTLPYSIASDRWRYVPSMRFDHDGIVYSDRVAGEIIGLPLLTTMYVWNDTLSHMAWLNNICRIKHTSNDQLVLGYKEGPSRHIDLIYDLSDITKVPPLTVEFVIGNQKISMRNYQKGTYHLSVINDMFRVIHQSNLTSDVILTFKGMA
jgi:hypothetical protein